MKITLQKSEKAFLKTDLLIACTFKAQITTKKAPAKKKAPIDAFLASKTIKELDEELAGHLLSSASEEGFLASEGQHFITATLGRTKAKGIALLGMGDASEQTVDLFRRAGGEAYKLAQKRRASSITFVIPEGTTIPLFDVIQASVEGMRLASYRFNRYHTKEKNENLVKEIEFHIPRAPTSEQKLALTRANEISKAVFIARDLINEGPMELNPVKFAAHASKLAKDYELDLEVLDEHKLKKEKMNLLLAVASAAEDVAPPRLIRLHYKPKKSKVKIALLGKGVTFDSGGLDIKTAEGMLDMKIDMSGAAAVLATMCAISKISPKAEVIGYMACVENGVGPHSYHPGDVIISRKGLSVEISNTDAEGRLILADTISYTIDKDKPDIIIDVATLTGACMVALGTRIAGLFTNDDALFDALCQSGKAVGESFWRLPLSKPLLESLKSQVADIKNSGDRYGGAITGALFLQEFLDKGVKWAHLDIAGPASNNKPHAYLPMGGVGFGVRTLVDYLMSQG